MKLKSTIIWLVLVVLAAVLTLFGCSRNDETAGSIPPTRWAAIVRSTLDTVDFQLSAPAFNRLERPQRLYGWYLTRAVESLPVEGMDSTEAEAARGAVVDNLVNASDNASGAVRPALRALVQAFQQNTEAAWREYACIYRVLPPQPVEFFFEPSDDFNGKIRRAGVLVRDDEAQGWIAAADRIFNVPKGGLWAYQVLIFSTNVVKLFRRRSEPILRIAGRTLLVVNTPPNLPGFTPCDVLPAGLSPSQQHNLSAESVARSMALQCLTGMTGARAETVTKADSVQGVFIMELRPLLIGLRYVCRSAALTKVGLPETGLSEESAMGVFLVRSLAAIVRTDSTRAAVEPSVAVLALLSEEGLVGETELEGQIMFAFDTERVLNQLDVWSDNLLDANLLDSLMSVTPERAQSIVRNRLPKLTRWFTELKLRAVVWHYPRLETFRNNMGGMVDVKAQRL